MIEKLPFTEIHSGGEDMVDRVESRPVPSYEMQHKINEIIDYINQNNHEYASIEEVVKARENHIADTSKKIDAGEFAFLSKENSNLKDDLERITDILYESKYALEEIINPSFISHEQEMAQEALDKVNAEIKAITGENNDD